MYSLIYSYFPFKNKRLRDCNFCFESILYVYIENVCLGNWSIWLGVPTGFVKNTVLPLYVSIIFLIFRMLWLSYTEEMFGMMLKLSMLLQLLVFLKSQRLVTLLKIENNSVNSYYGNVIFSFLSLSLLL